MLIDVLFATVNDVGAPLLVNVAVLSGAVGLEDQLVPVVHSVPGPVQMPSTASAGDAPRQVPASSAARRRRKRRSEHDPFLRNRMVLWIPCVGRIFCGESVSTSPEDARASRHVESCKPIPPVPQA